MKGVLINIELLKKRYPKGTKIELDYMDDPRAVPTGTKGTVIIVDDMGVIHVNWENGSSLGICPEVDEFHVIG